MTFNLRFASTRPPNSWPERRPVMRECIERYSPDLIGTQEGLYAQLKDIETDLPGYATIGLGREGGSKGEFMMIFYRRDRFEPLEYDHFWLSDTPNVISSTSWGNTVKRMVTWVRFMDRRTRQEFYFVNTHFDHQVQVSREKSAELVRQRVDALKTTLPVLLVGDFNAVASANKAYDILTQGGGFTDLFKTSPVKRNAEFNSFTGFKPPVKNGEHIDWLLSRGPVKVSEAEIITFEKNGQTPSDHYPVMVVVTLGAK
ncbi:MAG: endonuclease/exonuclease/phosphatase family protein [Opitutaceae bacterium]|nr:endonuclease/exonuclease/phosphatase family protein [Verrucomicrobiales bacterium]